MNSFRMFGLWNKNEVVIRERGGFSEERVDDSWLVEREKGRKRMCPAAGLG